MTKEEKDQQTAKVLRTLADEIDPPVNQASKSPKPETSEAAQEAHEAELASFSTIIKDGLRQSLNSMTPPEEIEAEAFLKENKTENE
jgi:hypothetical protein